MSFTLLSRVLGSSALTFGLIAGCGESTPSCADVVWSGSTSLAQLTGAPLFSATEIAPGDPLTAMVPVNSKTRDVSVWIRSFDQHSPLSSYGAETVGGETVEIRVADTNLSAGVYVAYRLDLDGEIAPQFAHYIASNSEAPYVLSDFPAAELQRSCVTDITPPTFTVVAESASAPER